MSERKDLTRWNRAGLSRFRYVDGNAATYLETLRLALRERFTDPVSGKLQWQDLDVSVPPEESAQDRLERLVNQYQGERRDFGWEIARTLARSAHVLTEYLDAYANEGYLGTATQWDNLRRLVEMLDYHPAPPASASALLVLQAKKDKQGTVAQGFQVKNAPEDGSAPAIFETLKDLTIDAQLNELHLKNWDKSQESFDYAPCGGADYCAEFPLPSPIEGVSQGGKGVLLIDPAGKDTLGIPVTVNRVTANLLQLKGEAPPIGLNFPVKRHQARLLLQPDRIQKPQLIGDNTILLDRDHNLSVGTAIAWKEDSTWYAARVVSAEGRRLALFGRGLPEEGVDIFRLHSAGRQRVKGVSKLIIPPLQDRKNNQTVWKSDLSRIPEADIGAPGGEPFDLVTTSGVSKVFYLSKKTETSGEVLQRRLQQLKFDGDPGDLESGQWLLLVGEAGQQFARRIDTLEKGEGEFTLTLRGDPLGGTLKLLYGEFALPVFPADFDKNLTPVTGSTLELETLPAALEKGRQLLLKSYPKALAVTVTAVDSESGTVTVSPEIPCHSGSSRGGDSGSCDFTRHGTLILGNVAEAGHGESKPGAILGSGDAAKSKQSFLSKTRDIAFVADPTQTSGVRAAIEVSVDGRKWEQVATLNDSETTDPHYTVRMTEEGYVRIGFGDGVHGRRLPTGQNNVRITCRVGTGLAGNVEAGGLAKPVKPHPLVDSVSQPLDATGGNAMEGVESLRENAPASVLTLERAVSLADFTHLTASHSSVWQARAFAWPTGFSRQETVRVVVVPAGGGALGELKDELATFLGDHALPGVEVEVAPYQPLRLSLQVRVRVKTDEYDPEVVTREVRQALLSRFALQKAALGAPLYRSAIAKVVEAVTDVENSLCVIGEATLKDEVGAVIPVRHVARGADGTIRSIRPTEEQVIYLDEKKPALEVTVEKFSL